ncbi:MAG: pyridoxamine 5'-phosphate oxidase family protein [Spirochaetales bacterium]|nr:pyridoxamine 5'-phosphate oxidase family protein [Spirochaetales bacterium]
MAKRMTIDFTEAMNYVLDKVETKKIAVLSTAAENRVSSRTMSFIRLGEYLYFQTDNKSLKIQQIQKNENVAVCLDNIQIEAEAEILGHSSLPVNRDFVQKYKIEHPGSYKAYTQGINQVIIRLKMTLIVIWKYLDGKPYREFIWPEQKKAEREEYDVNSAGPLFTPSKVLH